MAGEFKAYSDALSAKSRAEFAQLRERWEKRLDGLAELSPIVRCHLVLEHYLIEYIEKRNPNLGSLIDARLNFPRILQLARGPKSEAVPTIEKGALALNWIRNRLAHDLSL